MAKTVDDNNNLYASIKDPLESKEEASGDVPKIFNRKIESTKKVSEETNLAASNADMCNYVSVEEERENQKLL